MYSDWESWVLETEVVATAPTSAVRVYVARGGLFTGIGCCVDGTGD